MALFKCSNCDVIENHSLVNPKNLKTEYDIRQHHIPGEMIPEVYPKMWLMDMQGQGDDDIKVNGEVWKKKEEIMMLCSKCNTGVWHNEFNREAATEEETEVACYSKYNYTTPAEHSVELEKCDSNPSGYKVKKRYKAAADGSLFLAAISTMVDFEEILNYSSGKKYKDRKPHWKETQSDKDRESKIQKALDKRARKLERKANG